MIFSRAQISTTANRRIIFQIDEANVLSWRTGITYLEANHLMSVQILEFKGHFSETQEGRIQMDSKYSSQLFIRKRKFWETTLLILKGAISASSQTSRRCFGILFVGLTVVLRVGQNISNTSREFCGRNLAGWLLSAYLGFWMLAVD